MPYCPALGQEVEDCGRHCVGATCQRIENEGWPVANPGYDRVLELARQAWRAATTTVPFPEWGSAILPYSEEQLRLVDEILEVIALTPDGTAGDIRTYFRVIQETGRLGPVAPLTRRQGTTAPLQPLGITSGGQRINTSIDPARYAEGEVVREAQHLWGQIQRRHGDVPFPFTDRPMTREQRTAVDQVMSMGMSRRLREYFAGLLLHNRPEARERRTMATLTPSQRAEAQDGPQARRDRLIKLQQRLEDASTAAERAALRAVIARLEDEEPPSAWKRLREPLPAPVKDEPEPPRHGVQGPSSWARLRLGAAWFAKGRRVGHVE